MATQQASGSFAALLQRLRRAAGLSQEELAERAGLSRRGITDLERGARRSPHPATVRRLADALGVADAQRAALLRAARPAIDRSESVAAVGRAGTNLPRSLTSFVGRAEQMKEVRRLLSGVRALSLVGVGGVGKTRLAVELASAALEDYAAGVRLVELAPLAEPQLLVETVAAAFGVREQPARPLVQTLAEALQGEELLLVLDNCEHLTSACATLASQLLLACPRLAVLATSREPLGFVGEMIWRVPPLDLPAGGEGPQQSVDELQGCEAVTLFVARAHAARADFHLNEQNASTVARLCQMLDGLPLAIELAAAWVSALTPHQIVARLHELLEISATERTGVPRRQQTLRATFDWSYGRLSAQEQRLFNRISVFAGGWTLAAAEAVCASADDEIQPRAVLPLLAHLVAKSLVQVEVVEDEARYRLLEVLRQYGQDHLEHTGEGDLTRSRHAGFYVDLAAAAGPELWGPAIRTWQAGLERELDNLRVALRWLIARGDVVQSQRLGAPLARFCQVANYLSEGRSWLSEVLELPSEKDSVERAQVLIGAGLLDTYLANYAAAYTELEQGVAVCRAAGDDMGLAIGLWGLGFMGWGRGDHEFVLKLADEGFTVTRRAHQAALEALHLFLCAVATVETGDRAAARALADQCLALSDEVGHIRTVPMALSALGWLSLLDEDYPTSAALAERAERLFMEVGFEVGAAWALGLMSRAAAAQGQAERAVARATEGLNVALALKLNVRVPWCLDELAEGLACAGQLEPAVRLAGAAEMLRRHAGTRSLPSEEIVRRRWMDPVRRALGPATDAAWAAGLAMSPRQAMAEVKSLAQHA